MCGLELDEAHALIDAGAHEEIVSAYDSTGQGEL
jgi:hypothetical protein